MVYLVDLEVHMMAGGALGGAGGFKLLYKGGVWRVGIVVWVMFIVAIVGSYVSAVLVIVYYAWLFRIVAYS